MSKRQAFLLIGQSNMAGRGRLEEVDAISSDRIEMFRDGTWQAAVEPLHTDKPKIAGIGLAMSFAQSLVDEDPDLNLGLIPCAVGGTPLSRWVPGADLYEAALAIAKQALQDAELVGILWHQGEGDAHAEETATTYAERFSSMIATLKAALGVGDVPVITGELGEFLVNQKDPNLAHIVNQELHSMSASVPNYACVSAAGLKDNGDELHFNAEALRSFGERYAAAFRALS